MHFFGGGGGFLVLGCLAALASNEPHIQFVGAFGILFFGAALLLMVYTLFQSRSRGLLQLSEDGIYLAHLGTVLPWQDIGPAWVSVTRTNGVTSKEVNFVLRNSRIHQKKMSRVGSILVAISRAFSHSRPQGKTDWGLTASLLAFGADLNALDQMRNQLRTAREQVLADKNATTFNIATPFRTGISAEDLVGIINSEIRFMDSHH